MHALNAFAFGAASLFVLVDANHGHLLPRSRHHGIAKRGQSFSGQATYYEAGMGACGKSNTGSDKASSFSIVALNAPQFGSGYPGPHCFQMVNICKGSECHPAQIVDMCPGCKHGSLDMSESLFKQFASTDVGVFPITWTFAGDGEPDEPEKPDPPKPTKKPDPTPEKPDPPKTSKEPEPEPEPTTSSKKHTTTSKPKPETTSTPEPTTSKSTSTTSEPTTTSTSEAKSTTSTSEIPSSTAETSAAASSTASTGSGPGSGSKSSNGNLADMNQAMLAFGKLITAAQEDA